MQIFPHFCTSLLLENISSLQCTERWSSPSACLRWKSLKHDPSATYCFTVSVSRDSPNNRTGNARNQMSIFPSF
ncbi:hypothetical protein E1A91_D02G098300v1 [Gossypium mustelinum]|uniref:Uncharacterized protein n=2 Tax=Gossypium TaxID=3633 RepID=A0A5D2VTP0_GOSMU|nr:hypothetical protein E1A91_D02G098300v1 [Gossypium mustelinum]